MIIAVIHATFAVAKRKTEENSGLYGIRTLDLCDTGAALYRRSEEFESRASLSFFSGFLFATVKVTYITAMIILHLILLSAVHICDFHIFKT